MCGQDVHELRDLQPPADLTAAHETRNSARSEMHEAEQRARLADQRTAETKAAVDHSTARQDETTAHLSDAETETELDTLEAKLDKDALDARQARTAASADAENARHLSPRRCGGFSGSLPPSRSDRCQLRRRSDHCC